MSVIQTCHDTKDTLDLFRPQGLYLKPVARLNVSVQLPQLKKSGAKISNWEVMERIKEMARPLAFPVFKVAKSSLEFIRFEAEIDNYGLMDTALAKLDMKTIKLSGFEEQLKVRAAESKTPFPTRHDWDSFFDSKHMNELKAGERPDTIHLKNLPTKWFVNYHDKSGVAKDKPSEYVLKKVFQTFGEIRAVDIPILDPYRNQMKSSISGINTFTFGQDLVFEAYVQFKEYIGFVKAMNSLKGMKLLYKDRHEDRAWVSNIIVDFDKTKHLADSTIKKRKQERDKLIEKEREKEDAERRRKELERMKREEELRNMKEKERDEILRREAEREEKIRRRMEREERRRQRKLTQKSADNEEEMNHRIAVEERKLLVAQRKLESIRLLDELLERVKVVQNANRNVKSLEKDLLKAAKAASSKLSKKSADITSFIGNDKDEKVLRDKLVSKLKQKEIDKMELHGEKLRNARKYYSDDDESMEDISDEALDEIDQSLSEGDDKLDEISADDLRLTSTDDGDEEEEGEVHESGKKAKKKKKEKKKKKKKEKKRKKKELESHISLAQRIAERDRRSRSRSRSRDRRRPSSPSPKKLWERGRSSREDAILEHRALIRERQLRSRLEAKQKEQAKEELYDKMVNPHLYGGGSGGYRKLRKGEHYEDVQRELLEKEIRIRERRERYKHEYPPSSRGHHTHHSNHRPRESDYGRNAQSIHGRRSYNRS